MVVTIAKSLLSGRKKKKSKSGKEMSQQVLNRSENVEEDKRPVIKPQNSLVPLSIKTTTIPTENLITTKEDSITDKLLMIKDLLGLQLRFRVSSFSQRMERMREERRKNREKELEEKKQKKKKIPFLSSLPKIGILDSLKNFLAFLAGGILLNLLLKNLDVLEGIGKTILSITTGIMQFAKFMWDGVIGFITTAYAGYDALRESVRDIGGDEAVEKFDRLSDLLKTVINGAIIAATIALVARPFLKGGCLPNPRNLRNPRNFNTRNNRINNRRTTSGGQQLNRGPFSRMREFFRKFRGGPTISGSGQNVGPLQRIGNIFRRGPNVTGGAQNLGPLQRIGNIFRRGPNVTGGGTNIRNPFLSGPNVTGGGTNIRNPLRPQVNVTGSVPKVGFMEGMKTQFKKIGEFVNPKNLKNINLKNLRPSGAAVRGVSTGLAKGAVLGVIGGLADMGVDWTFSKVSKKIGRDQVKNLVKKFGVEESVNMIEKRLVEEDNKPVAPWWLLGLMDGHGLGTSRYRDQKFINKEAYKLMYLTDEFLKESDKEVDTKGKKSSSSSKLSGNIFRGNEEESIFEVSKGGSGDAVDFMKNIVSVDDLAQDTSYSKGSYGLISDITTFIQPIVQEV